LDRLGLQLPWLDGDFNFDDYGLSDSEITAHIDIAPYVALKKRALAAHRSQIPQDFFYLTLPDEALQQYAGVEFYVRVHPPAQPGEHEDNLFAGTEVSSAAA
jgi:LmbE family N-acetylglucosaminyl deacetylase